MGKTVQSKDKHHVTVHLPVDWRGRPTWAEVNLDAISANCRALLDVAHPAGLIAVVKANAYGHGLLQVAQTAVESGATWIACNTVGEASVVRAGGVQTPILLLGPFGEDETDAVLRLDLTPTLHSVQAAQWLHARAAGKTVSFHLEIDTGMSRAGIEPDHSIAFMHAVSKYGSLRPEGLFSHLACADEPDRDVTDRQFRLFRETESRLRSAGFIFRIRHLANSAGMIVCRDAHLDLVRAGIGLYGYSPRNGRAHTVALAPALGLYSRVTRIQKAASGTGVGYGHDFVCSRPSVLALVPIGYGDGLQRRLGGGIGHVLIREHLLPIVGRVSMDQVTVDVTDVKGVNVGDIVTVIGTQGCETRSAEDLAEEAGTISYEILTGLQQRVPRVYVKGGRIVATSTLTGTL